MSQEPLTTVREKENSLISNFITETFIITLLKRVVKVLYLQIISALITLYKSLDIYCAFAQTFINVWQYTSLVFTLQNFLHWNPRFAPPISKTCNQIENSITQQNCRISDLKRFLTRTISTRIATSSFSASQTLQTFSFFFFALI